MVQYQRAGIVNSIDHDRTSATDITSATARNYFHARPSRFRVLWVRNDFPPRCIKIIQRWSAWWDWSEYWRFRKSDHWSVRFELNEANTIDWRMAPILTLKHSNLAEKCSYLLAFCLGNVWFCSSKNLRRQKVLLIGVDHWNGNRNYFSTGDLKTAPA